MVNSNLNVKIVPFFDSVKNPLTADKTCDSFWNQGYDNLALEVSGVTGESVEIKIEGCINTQNKDGVSLPDSGCSWTVLSLLDATVYNQTAKITTNGIYYVNVAGISRIRVSAENVSGSLIIVGAFSK